jgi:Arc/MetJ family transcription regulator
MIKRTTIEIDQQLLSRAKRAMGLATARATVEEALRRAADAAEQDRDERRARQIDYLQSLTERVDVDVLLAGRMWR